MKSSINLLLALAAILLVTSCGRLEDNKNSDRYADSLSELISQTLEGTGEDSVSDIERPILEKAAQAGHIQQADYDDAKQAEIACLKNYGYELEIINHASGVIELQPGPADIGLYPAEREGEILWECAKKR